MPWGILARSKFFVFAEWSLPLAPARPQTSGHPPVFPGELTSAVRMRSRLNCLVEADPTVLMRSSHSLYTMRSPYSLYTMRSSYSLYTMRSWYSLSVVCEGWARPSLSWRLPGKIYVQVCRMQVNVVFRADYVVKSSNGCPVPLWAPVIRWSRQSLDYYELL